MDFQRSDIVSGDEHRRVYDSFMVAMECRLRKYYLKKAQWYIRDNVVWKFCSKLFIFEN